MPRRRVVDSKIWTDDKFIELNSDEKLLFIGMMNFSDDKGIHKNNPKVLKIEIFPADPKIDFKCVEDMIKTLLNHELLLMSEDKKLLRYVNWETYQKIQHKTPSKYEDKDGNIIIPFTYHYNNGTIKEPYNDNNDTIPLCHNIIEDNIIEDKVIESNTKEQKVKENSSKSKTDLIKEEFTFDRFISLYPRKIRQEMARNKFKVIAAKHLKAVFDGLDAWNKYWIDNAVDVEFIPYPSTWLNQKQWNDKVDVSEKPKKFKSDLDEEIHTRNHNIALESKRMKRHLEEASKDATEEVPNLLADFKRNKNNNAQPIKDIIEQMVPIPEANTHTDGK